MTGKVKIKVGGKKIKNLKKQKNVGEENRFKRKERYFFLRRGNSVS